MQLFLLLVALICVPIMLLGEPLVYRARFKAMYGNKHHAMLAGHN